MKKKKAAILTWCNNNGRSNYGQILQCYAVQKIVESWGYDAFVVLYQREGYIINENTERAKSFYRFIEKYIRRSAPCYTKEGIERETREAELLVCGSDQVWNPACFDPVYFLDFGREEQKRIAFAVSGIFEDKAEYKEIYRQMAELVGRFDTVTFREQTGASVLGNYSEKKIKVISDPTLQVDRQLWDEIAVERIEKEDFVFCYFIGSLKPYQLIVREVARMYGVKKILFIPSNEIKEGSLPRFFPINDAGPAEFLSLIKYAKAVCTDSFHGVTMSMVYDIPFFVAPRMQWGKGAYSSMVRIEDLLKERKMESRMVRNVLEVRNIRKLENKVIGQQK